MSPKDPRIDHLRSLPLFRACNEKQLEFIVTRVEEVDIPAGKVLTQEGKSGGAFFIILTGEVDVMRGSTRMAKLGIGDYFGEIALLDNGTCTATVTATQPSRCLVLSPAQFQDVLYQDATIAVSMLHSAVRRLRATAPLPSD
jgi:CRP/FNR family transcriptional regulator, cyclic AMP receptor protein